MHQVWSVRSRACRRSRSGNQRGEWCWQSVVCNTYVPADVGFGNITFHDDFWDQLEVRLVGAAVVERT